MIKQSKGRKKPGTFEFTTGDILTDKERVIMLMMTSHGNEVDDPATFYDARYDLGRRNNLLDDDDDLFNFNRNDDVESEDSDDDYGDVDTHGGGGADIGKLMRYLTNRKTFREMVAMKEEMDSLADGAEALEITEGGEGTGAGDGGGGKGGDGDGIPPTEGKGV